MEENVFELQRSKDPEEEMDRVMYGIVCILRVSISKMSCGDREKAMDFASSVASEHSGPFMPCEFDMKEDSNRYYGILRVFKDGEMLKRWQADAVYREK